jgi:hypothetical protein
MRLVLLLSLRACDAASLAHALSFSAHLSCSFALLFVQTVLVMAVLLVGPSAALDSVGPLDRSVDGEEDLANSDMASASGKDGEEQGLSSDR